MGPCVVDDGYSLLASSEAGTRVICRVKDQMQRQIAAKGTPRARDLTELGTRLRTKKYLTTALGAT